jgi:SAM-dependent methyltransferase
MLTSSYRRGRLFAHLQEASRRRKFSIFMRTMPTTDRAHVLDLGCGYGTFLEELYPWRRSIVALDIGHPQVLDVLQRYDVLGGVVGDAAKLPFGDDAFEVVFCNAVMEHLPPGLRAAMAGEISRVSQHYFVVTPNRSFPFEPHSKTFFLHWMPSRLFRACVSSLHRLGTVSMSPSYYFEPMRLSEMKSLFPDATVKTMCGGAHLLAYR